MTNRKISESEIKCAQRVDGHQYQRKHREFNCSAALKTFWETGNWEHLTQEEAMATMSLLETSFQHWKRSGYVSDEDLDGHYEAFHSLYDLLKDT
jgi:hypothetical protein